MLSLLVCVLLAAVGRCTADLLHTGDFDPPRIYPETKEYIVTSGGSVTFRCEGREPVAWVFPEVPPEVELTSITNISVASTLGENYPYGVLLQLYNVNYLDVGFYTCRFNTTDTEYDLREQEEQGLANSVYLYVEDDEHLHTYQDIIAIFANQYDSVTIPCKPTLPNIHVTLMKDNEVIGNSSESISTVTYSPKLGFKFLVSSVMQDGAYMCTFENTNKKGRDLDEQDELAFYLKVTTRTYFVSKPVIKETSSGTGHALEGGTLDLICVAHVNNGVLFTMEWEIPDMDNINNTDKVYINSTRTEQSEMNMQEKVATTSITVKNITYKDQGHYRCKIKDNSNNMNNDTKFIQVLKYGTSFINLTDPLGKYHKEAKAGKNFQWIIKVDAFPKPQLDWYDNRGQEIIPQNNPKYEIKTTHTNTLLKINDVTLQDAGVYQLRAINEATEATLNITLTVKDKPVVRIEESSQYFIEGTAAKIECYVVGYPIPEVKWYFQSCKFYPNCGMELEHEIDPVNYETKQTDILPLTSTLDINATTTGTLRCSARNSEGSDSHSSLFLITDVPGGFGIWGVEQDQVIAVGEEITIHCGASVYNFTGELTWFKTNPIFDEENKLISASDDIVVSNEDVSVTNSTTKYSYRTSIHFKSIKKSDSGEYKCRVNAITLNDDDYEAQYIHVNVQDLMRPIIVHSTNMNESDISKSLGETSILFSCEAEGVPIPKVAWFKDDVPFAPPQNDTRVVIQGNGTTLLFQYMQIEDEGSYTCTASNKAGQSYKTTRLTIKNKPGLHIGLVTAIAVMVLVFIGMTIFLVIRVKKERKMRKELAVAGLAHFEEGALESINPDLGVDDQAELLPYDRKWEFPRDKLKLGKQLGSGAFGVVLKAEAHGLCDEEEATTVAVKMVKRTADPTFIKALASELKIMVHLGKHLNVVNLLGACTKNVSKRELLVIVEYCRYGNIHNYLLRHRNEFIDQVDPRTGLLDTSIGAEALARAYSMSSDRSRLNKLGEFFSSSGDPRGTEVQGNTNGDSDSLNGGYLRPISHPSDYRAGVANNTGQTDVTLVSMAPTGDEALMSNSSAQPEWRSNYRGDYRGDVRPVCTQDLLCWAFQVARGMEYLASRKVMHGDLAARNILLAEDNVVKICDFGLAKSMYNDDNYKKKGDGPLPVKWMAVESIRDRVFSTQSDVWSYGVVLWELFSLARTPYPGMEANEKLYMKLVDGYRMEQPQFAHKPIYQTMLDCWAARPTNRPTFTDLAECLGAMLEEGVRAHYVDLNEPYLTMNTQAGGPSDYLAMMSAPDFHVLHSPQVGPSRDYVNTPRITGETEGDASGYLCMSPSASGGIFSPRDTSTSPAFKFPSPEVQTIAGSNPDSYNSSPASPDLPGPSSNQPRSRKKLHDANAFGIELTPMLGPNAISSDSETELSPNITNPNVNLNTDNVVPPPSFSNPSYRTLFDKTWENKNNGDDTTAILKSKDNYVNYPQQKQALKNTNVLNSDAYTNPHYVTMGDDHLKSSNASNDYVNIKNNENPEHHYVN